MEVSNIKYVSQKTYSRHKSNKKFANVKENIVSTFKHFCWVEGVFRELQ